jgi:hypothetical protein
LLIRRNVTLVVESAGNRAGRPTGPPWTQEVVMARIEDRVTGWWVFAGMLLGIAGILNIIWGLAAIGDAKFFIADQKYIISSLHTWGWVTLIIGVLQLVAAFSLFSGGGFGRWLGMFAAALSAISALLSIPAYPFWSLCIFALAIIVLYELAKAPERRTLA